MHTASKGSVSKPGHKKIPALQRLIRKVFTGSAWLILSTQQSNYRNQDGRIRSWEENRAAVCLLAAFVPLIIAESKKWLKTLLPGISESVRTDPLPLLTDSDDALLRRISRGNVRLFWHCSYTRTCSHFTTRRHPGCASPHHEEAIKTGATAPSSSFPGDPTARQFCGHP